jgi:hypothetical protein
LDLSAALLLGLQQLQQDSPYCAFFSYAHGPRLFLLGTMVCLPWIENSEAEPPEKGWLERRKEAFDEIGSELIAFADTNSIIAQTLAKSRYFALRAGNDLRLLGAVCPGTNSWTDIRKRVRSALRFDG